MHRYDWKKEQALCIAVTVCTLLLVGCDYKTTGGATPASAPTNSVSLAARAALGDKGAMRALAQAYGLGTDGQKKDELLAFKWYLKLAEGGDATAMAEVARRYREGNGVRSDFDESLQWADKGAVLGDADALYLSAIRIPFDFGFGWQVNLDVDSQEKKLIVDSADELNRLTRAAEGGNSEAKFRLGRLLRTGVWYTIRGKLKPATTPNSEKAIHWLRGAADAGFALAILELAQWYQKGGDGLKADTSIANQFWDRVESVASSDGQYAIGREIQPPVRKYYKSRIWRDQMLTYQQASWKSREWLEKSAAQGHMRAALELGRMLSSEQYRYLNESKAFEFLMTDESKAFEFLMKAAEAGLVEAQTAISQAYMKGSGVAKNYERAYVWALRAATHATASRESMLDAQNFVAYMRIQGLGVEKDGVLAYAWANVTAATGQKYAREMLARLDQELSENQIQEAQQISGAWKLGDDMVRISASASTNKPPAASSPDSVANGATKLVGSGTGFFVSTSGTLVTNFHVAGKCAIVKLPALSKKANVIATDAANDLAVLRVDDAPDSSARLGDASKLRQGQEVVAFGFPLEGYLPSAGNITTGLLSALSGPGNNSSLIQISAPVQQGSSGGPVLDSHGEVVGVVVGKADAVRIAKATGDILQNVNFAVSVGTLQAFLDAN